METDFMGIGEVAKQFDRTQETIRAWCRAGRIPVYREPVTNNRVFRKGDVEKLMEELKPTSHDRPS